MERETADRLWMALASFEGASTEEIKGILGDSATAWLTEHRHQLVQASGASRRAGRWFIAVDEEERPLLTREAL